MEKVLIINPEKCTRCRICELVCSFSNFSEYNPKRSLIRIISNKDMNVNIPTILTGCNYCGECVTACPTKVLEFVNLEEGAIIRKKMKINRFPAPILSDKIGELKI